MPIIITVPVIKNAGYNVFTNAKVCLIVLSIKGFISTETGLSKMVCGYIVIALNNKRARAIVQEAKKNSLNKNNLRMPILTRKTMLQNSVNGMAMKITRSQPPIFR
jgi:hypothetical protein